MKLFISTFFISIFVFGIFGQSKVTVAKTYTIIHVEPDSESKAVVIATKNEKLILLSTESENGWYRVSTGKLIGWVIAADIEMLPPNTIGVSKQPATPSTYTGRGNYESALYINPEYNFSFEPPPNSELDEEFNKKAGFVTTYTCKIPNCNTVGFFALLKTSKLNLPMADVVKSFQLKETQEAVAKELLEGFKSEFNPTILSKKYVAYSGRPAIRVDFNFTVNEISFTGAGVALFIDEKKSVAGFGFVSEDSQYEKWSKLGENILRSIKIFTNSPITAKPPREGIATRIGTSNSEDKYPAVPKRISGGVLNGKALDLPKPSYPAAARAVQASGAVNVQVRINHDGGVIEAKAVSGHPLLQKAAEDVALQATFKPTLLSGQKVEVIGVIVYNFIP